MGLRQWCTSQGTHAKLASKGDGKSIMVEGEMYLRRPSLPDSLNRRTDIRFTAHDLISFPLAVIEERLGRFFITAIRPFGLDWLPQLCS